MTSFGAAFRAAPAQSTVRISVDASGVEGNADSAGGAMSADGSVVAFRSFASNLVSGDTNGVPDVFVFELNGSPLLVRASVGPGGVEANNSSSEPSISANGRFVGFTSLASNLDPTGSDVNGVDDIYVHDRTTGVTNIVSRSSSGAVGNQLSARCALSADGAFIAFESEATNFDNLSLDSLRDIFVHDTTSQQTVRITVDTSGSNANGGSQAASLSSDGRFVAFWSTASNLVAVDTNGKSDVFVRDRLLGTTQLVSVSDGPVPVQGNQNLQPFTSISGDGLSVVFSGPPDNLVASDTNNFPDVFVRDLLAGSTRRVSVGPGGVEALGPSDSGLISSDGRIVAFASPAANLVPGDANGVRDTFVHDIALAVTARVSVASSGIEANGTTVAHGISSNGQFVTFSGMANNLVTGDGNGVPDVFRHDRGCVAPVGYCTAGTTTNACTATLSSTGTPSAAGTSGFALSANQVEGQKQGLFFYGTSGPIASRWGSGGTSFLCVKSPTQRTPVQNSGGIAGACSGQLSFDFLAFMAANPSALGQPLAAGQAFHAQAWFRDPPAVKSTNFSDALTWAMCP